MARSFPRGRLRALVDALLRAGLDDVARAGIRRDILTDAAAAKAWLGKFTTGVAFGPAAVVVDDVDTYALVEMISTLVSGLFELRPFDDRARKEQWLFERVAGPRSSE